MEIQDLRDEEIYELVKELLPQIEADIRTEVDQQLKAEYQEKLEQVAEQVEQNALNELDAIFLEVQSETQKQFQEKLKELEEKEEQLDQELTNLESIVRAEVEQKVKKDLEDEKANLVTNIIDEINAQGFSEDMETEIRERLQREQEEEIRAEMQKKEKQLKVTLQRKLEQEKKQLEEFYRLEVKAKVDKEKKLLEKEKAELARLKSLRNLKVNKLDTDKQSIRQQIQQQEQKYNILVENLQQQIEQVTQQVNILINQQQQQQQQQPKGILKNSHSAKSLISNSNINNNNGMQNQQNYGSATRGKSPSQQENFDSGNQPRQMSQKQIQQKQQNQQAQDDGEFERKYLSNNNSVTKAPFQLSQTYSNNALLDQTGDQQFKSNGVNYNYNENDKQDILNSFTPLSPPGMGFQSGNYRQQQQQQFPSSNLAHSSSGSALNLIPNAKPSADLYNDIQKKQDMQQGQQFQTRQILQEEQQYQNQQYQKDTQQQQKQNPNWTQASTDKSKYEDFSLSLATKERLAREKRTQLENKMAQNDEAREKYAALENYFLSNLVNRVAVNEREALHELVFSIVECWGMKEVSILERIDLIDKFDSEQSTERLKSMLKQHLKELREDIKLGEKIIQKMNLRDKIILGQIQGQRIRDRLSMGNVPSASRLFALTLTPEIKTINDQILSLVNEFNILCGKQFTWQGFVLKDLIQVELDSQQAAAQSFSDIKSLILQKISKKIA